MTARSTGSNRCVALIGMRGSGKTTVGAVLAQELGWKHFDTDEMIESQTGLSIAAIFESEGEIGFRKRERNAIADVAQTTSAVISVGGGAVLDDDNVRILRAAAKMVWLDAPAEVLWSRVSTDPRTGTTRPAFTQHAGLEELRSLCAQREPFYERAVDHKIDTAQTPTQQIAQQIIELLGLIG